MKTTFTIFTIFALTACSSGTNSDTRSSNGTPGSETEQVRAAFLAQMEKMNTMDLTDSVNYNEWKDGFAQEFTMLGGKGEPLVDKESILEGWRGLFKTHKPDFDITVDKIDVSGDLAYVLYHYREQFTSIETGQKAIDVMHSAIMVVKKNQEGKWKATFLTWN